MGVDLGIDLGVDLGFDCRGGGVNADQGEGNEADAGTARYWFVGEGKSVSHANFPLRRDYLT